MKCIEALADINIDNQLLLAQIGRHGIPTILRLLREHSDRPLIIEDCIWSLVYGMILPANQILFLKYDGFERYR